MKIGLYFGSFNPIHNGHLIIANHVLNETKLDKIWFIVSPQNPLKNSGSLLNEYDRLHLVRLAIIEDNRFKASDIEFHLPRPSYTVDTLAYLSEKFPDNEFSIIMGADSFQNIRNWKNYKNILEGYTIYIYQRSGFDIKPGESENIVLLGAPRIDISATHIRELIKQRKSIRYLVPEIIREEIVSRNFFYLNT